MAISQLCLSCGRDLARVRVRREEIYGLPLVTCPHCGAYSVRRPHPVRAWWREMLRLDAALLAMVVQLVLAAGLVAAVTSVCMIWPQAYSIRGAALLDEPWLLLPAVLSFVALPAVLGMWLTAGLGHWSRGTPWAVFAVIVIALLMMDTVAAPAATRGMHALGMDVDLLPWSVRMLSARVGVLAAIMAIATAGIAPAHAARRGWQRFRTARWRARRRRRRGGRAWT